MMASTRATWRSPVFSQILENRNESLLIVGACVVSLGFNMAGLSGWACPIRAATGVPGPGCGLTTAIGQLLKGDLTHSFQTHAFAPIFLLALIMMLAAVILPTGARQKFLAAVHRAESRTGFTVWVLLAFILYWSARLPGLL